MNRKRLCDYLKWADYNYRFYLVNLRSINVWVRCLDNSSLSTYVVIYCVGGHIF